MEKILNRPIAKIGLPGQIYERLKADILVRRRKKTLPGTRALAVELNVSRNSVIAAMKLLKAEGLVTGGSQGRAPAIARSLKANNRTASDIAILSLSPLNELPAEDRALIFSIQDAVRHADFDVGIATPSSSLRSSMLATKNWLNKQAADIFIPYEFTREALEHLLTGNTPILAAGGAFRDLPVTAIANNFIPATRLAIRKFVEFGHTRIINLLPPYVHNFPDGPFLQAIREEFAEGGIKPSVYNIPQWEHSGNGLRTLLKSLFKVTPPTAFIAWDANIATGLTSFLNEHGLKIPDNVSVLVLTEDDTLSWLSPGLSFHRAKPDEKRYFATLRKRLQEAARRRPKPRVDLIPAIFIEGNSVGRAQ